VAGWVPGSAAQMRYVKESVKRTIVASRLIMSSGELGHTSIVDRALTSSENFHGIKLSENSWSKSTNYKSFFAQVNKIFSVDSLGQRGKKSLKEKCWRNAFKQYVLMTPGLEAAAKKAYQKNPNWKTKARAKVGKDHLAGLLLEDFARLPSLVSHFVSLVEEDLKMINPLKMNKKRKPVERIQCNREHFDGSGHRVRIRWSTEEDSILVTMKKAENSWVLISKRIGNGRSNVDCKDRFRNLLTKFNSLVKLYDHFSIPLK
jgi:hypothetical protein